MLLARDICFNDDLAENEKEVRDFMINIFNPALKYVLFSKNMTEAKKYGFNTCRQTAVFATVILRNMLPDYNFKAYEGDFEEWVNGKMEPYVHAFSLGEHNGKVYLVDLSRTSKRLLFTPVFSNLYPNTEDYKNMVYYDKNEIDMEFAMSDAQKEYLTGLYPSQVLNEVKALMTKLMRLSNDALYEFVNNIYDSFTYIAGRGRRT